MTDPDQPFQRPAAEHVQPGDSIALHGGGALAGPTPRTDPLILDPEFHQSVWKPWEKWDKGGEPPSPDGDNRAPAASAPRTNAKRTAIIAVAAVAVLAMVAGVLASTLLRTTTWPPVPLVEDLPSAPKIAWTGDGGEKCDVDLDEDHAVMTEAGRVWSLDLRDGRTRWSVNLPGDELRLSCMPGATMVAVTVGDLVRDDVVRTLLLDGSTGATVAELPGTETLQVIPLGNNIGLLDRSNMLRAVRPGRIDDPLWSQQLPGTAEHLSPIQVQQVDDTTVQLLYTSAPDADEREEGFMPVLSLEDGDGPPWSRGSQTEPQLFERVGDVILRHRFSYGMRVSALDLHGSQLWSLEEEAQAVLSGSRLYLATPGPADSDPAVRELREVDPRSGEPLSDDVFSGQFDYAVAAPQGRVALWQTGALTILDNNLKAQPTIRDIDYGGTYLGEELLYTGGNMQQDSNARRTRLTAIDPSTSRVVWDFYLDPSQRIDQMGRHLVVVDNGGKTLQGLTSKGRG